MRLFILLLLCGISDMLQASDSIPPIQLIHSGVSLTKSNSFRQTVDKATGSRIYQMTYIGVPLIAGGLLVKNKDKHFRSLRNEYLPVFRKRYDDYLQYLPAAVMLGMKAGGVEGRSSWGRMLASDAFSVALMAAAVNSLKTTSKVMRPDGSNNHSFPSGHTATAFMTATMLSKEYGGRSPWYSIGAYSVATATGLSRMMNNKHWLSDVMVGAGIGILSTELGYYLADLIFKEKGIRRFSTETTFDRFSKPSFLGIYLGFNTLPGRHRLIDNSGIALSTGSNAGIEGAYFFNPYIGIGGRLTIANMPVILNNEAQDESLDMISGYAGAYFSYPFSSQWMVGSKLLAGYTYLPECTFTTITIGKKGSISMGTGCSLTFRAKQNLGIKFFFDYNLMKSPIPLKTRILQVLTVGSVVAVSF